MAATALTTPPSTKSVPSKDKKLPQRSPYELNRRTLRENLTAGMKYHLQLRVSPTLLGKSFIDSARKTILESHWSDLLAAESIVAAVEIVKSMGYSNSPQFDHAVTNLLNVISRSYVEIVHGAASETTPAVVFSGPSKGTIPGDYLAACSKPDMTAFMATWALLMKALATASGKPFISRQEFMDLLGVGEWKPKRILDIKGQLLWYLSALNRYRPDLAIVYGIFIVDNTVRLTEHSACGTTESSSVDLGHVETWVAFVVLLYHCHQSRDDRFSPPPRPDCLARWSVETAPGVSSVFRPFHSGNSPGRVTWLAYEQEPKASDIACGFLKVSWQDVSSKFNEPALLERAHKGGWLPGLVRHHWAQRITSNTVSLGGTTRVKEIVHLASIGDPLSQCTSVLHLFKVIFDAIGVHENLMGQDILHRDLSWFNLLCNPRHHRSTEGRPVKLGVPTIEYILTNKPSEPCALLLDLDHGALMTELYSATNEGRTKKSGTPMFVAVELSSKIPQAARSFTESLVQRLEAFDALPEEWRRRAFPDDNGEFMKVFKDIDDREDRRGSRRHEHHEARTDPSSLHKPRHDMESLYWVVLWALLRASPLFKLLMHKVSTNPQAELTLRAAAQTLLNHSLEADEQSRNSLRIDPPIAGLHDALSKFGGLLTHMSAYLRVPWHLYEGKVDGLKPNHVHVAFRRLLLLQIYEMVEKKTVEDVAFTPRRPRNIRDESNFGQDLGPLPSRSTGTPYSPYLSSTLSTSSDVHQNVGIGSGDGRPLTFAGTASQRGSKRSAAEDLDQPQPSTKRARGTANTAAASPGEHTTIAEAPVPDAQPVAAAQDNPLNIVRLVNAFFDDRNLWFGVGDHQPQKDPIDGTPGVETDGAQTGTTDAPASPTSDTGHAA